MCLVKKYVWIALISGRSNLAYFGEVASRLIFLAVILYIFLRLWETTFSEVHAQRLGGLTLQQMLWYLTITEAIMLSAPRVAAAVDEDVRSGAFSMQLTRPISYELYRFSTNLGERVVRFVINLAVGSLITGTLVGAAAVSGPGCLLLLCALPLAFAIDFLGHFLVGLSAFWFEDSSGLQLIYQRLTMILGGMLLPIELFPGWIQPVVKALPFSAVVYGPARLFVEPNWERFFAVLVTQITATVVLALAVYGVYNRALKRVFVNGG